MGSEGVPCYYCDGTGGVEIQTDVDRWDRREACGECHGTGVSCRVAGERYTGYPAHRDPLTAMRELRTRYLTARDAEPYVASYRRPSAANCWIDYDNARTRAMRPCSRLVQADMLALAARCVNRVTEALQVAA